MKILLMLTVFLSSFTLEASIDSYWYEFDGQNKSKANELEFEKVVQAITSSQEEALSLEDGNNKSRGWSFAGLKTVLALGLSGKIGLKSWGGTKAVELNWARKSSSLTESNHDGAKVVSLRGDMSLKEWSSLLSEVSENFESEGLIEGSKGFSKYLVKETSVFRELIKGVESVKSSRFEASKLRLDITVGFSNSVGGFLVKAGGDLRIRFEWKPSTNGLTNDKSLPSKIQKETRKLLEKMGPVLVDAMEEEYLESRGRFSDKYALKEFRLGIATTLEGDLGFAKGSQGIAAYVYFTPKKSKSKYENLDGYIEFVEESSHDKIWPFTKRKIVKLSKRKIKKGIKKAIRFGHYFGDKIKTKQNSKWGVDVLKTYYAFSLKGDVGVVTVKGEPSIEIAYKSKVFNKALIRNHDKGLFNKVWGLDTLRVRTRLKGEIEVPWLAKFEVKSFVETYYKK